MTAYTNGGNTRNRKLTSEERRAAMLRCHPELAGKSGEEIIAIFGKPENGGALRNPELEAIGKSIDFLALCGQSCEAELDKEGYDVTCRMQDKAEWAHEFLMAVFDELLDYELEIVLQGALLPEIVTPCLIEGLEAAAHTYLAAMGVHRLHNNSKCIVPNNMDEFRLRVDDFFGFRREPVKFVPQPAPVLPQTLQDPRDVTDLIAATASKLSIKQKREAGAESQRRSDEHEMAFDWRKRY